MENNEFEYYVIERKGDKPYPLIATHPDSDITRLYIGDDSSIYRGKPIPDPELMKFIFSNPIPKKPAIGDYFSHPESVVSKKIADVLIAMNIKGVQLIPATVESDKGDIYKDFYFVYTYHYIEAMDKENSDYRLSSSGSGVYFIDSFYLDEEVLKEIPLEERLVFKLKEKSSLKLYHRSIVDAIMATHPEGVMFTAVEDWAL